MTGDDPKDELNMPIPASVMRGAPVIPPKPPLPQAPTRAAGTGTGTPWSERREVEATGRVKIGEDYLPKQDSGQAR